MAANISWFGSDGVNEILPAGSGEFDTLGFFGDGGFGFSVPVGDFQSNSFSCNDDGTAQSGQVPNLKFAAAGSGFVAAESSPTALSGVQLGEGTLLVRFTNDVAVKAQNVAFRAFDGSSISNDPSGVTIQAFEMLGQPSGSGQGPSDFNTLGDTSWTEVKGTTTLSMADQLFDGTTHDFYLGVSGRPDSIGAKTFGYFFELEFF